MSPDPQPALRLDGSSLSLEDLAPLLHDGDLRVEVDPACHEGIRASRAMVGRHVEAGDVVYGLTTGFGRLKNVAVDRADLAALQRNLIRKPEPRPKPTDEP